MSNDPKREINEQLYKLKKYSLNGNIGSPKNIEKLSKRIAKIHSHDVNPGYFKLYGAEWITEQVSKIEDGKIKNDILLALKTMSQVEVYNAPLKKYKFLAWDIIQSDWHKDYKSGRAGSYAWDIACVINQVNDPKFSEIFLEVYLRHGGEKPNLAKLHANLYYIRVFEAIKSGDFENIVNVTREIIEERAFRTEIISYETITKLNIIVF